MKDEIVLMGKMDCLEFLESNFSSIANAFEIKISEDLTIFIKYEVIISKCMLNISFTIYGMFFSQRLMFQKN